MLKITAPSLTLKTIMITEKGPKSLLNTTKTRLDCVSATNTLAYFYGLLMVKKNSLQDACPLTKLAAEFSMSRFINFHKKTWKTRQLSGAIMLKITTPSLTLKTIMIRDNGPITLLNTTKTRLDCASAIHTVA